MFGQKTIMIVDDEPVVREVLKAALEPAGANIVEAYDGSHALEVAWREQPDVAVIDVGLPKLSGVDVCRALQTNPNPPVVILITGNVYAEELDGCGAEDVFAKPFQPLDLLDAVERCLGGVPA
jgi:two-component system OmpR family response regulator